MDSSHFTRSKARRPSASLDTPSDVEPDDVAPEIAESGTVGFQVKVARGPESLPQELAGKDSGPLALALPMWELSTSLERPESALEKMGQFGSPRSPSLSPHQNTGSYGAPSPPIGSDIEEYFPVAKTAMYKPSLLEIWADTGQASPTHTAGASVDASRAGPATGESQPGPAESAGAEERPGSLAHSCVGISSQQGMDRPTVVASSPFYQSSLQPVANAVTVVSGLTGAAFAASQYAAVHADVAVHTTSETLTAQSLLLLGRHTTTPQSSPHSSVQRWLQSNERVAASPPLVEPIPSSGYAGHQTTLPMGAEAATLAPCVPRPSHASRSIRRTRRSGTSSVAAEFVGFTREMSGHMLNMVTQIQAQAQMQHDQGQNKMNQILAQAENQRVDAMKREENNLAPEKCKSRPAKNENRL